MKVEKDIKTICDKCCREISEDEANECDIKGDWIGATLCNDCYADEIERSFVATKAVKVTWIEEEWYPVYEIKLAKEDKKEKAFEIPEEKYREYQRVMAEFKKMQDYIESIVGAE